jgi:hypothetical protein
METLGNVLGNVKAPADVNAFAKDCEHLASLTCMIRVKRLQCELMDLDPYNLCANPYSHNIH